MFHFDQFVNNYFTGQLFYRKVNYFLIFSPFLQVCFQKHLVLEVQFDFCGFDVYVLSVPGDILSFLLPFFRTLSLLDGTNSSLKERILKIFIYFKTTVNRNRTSADNPNIEEYWTKLFFII